MSLSESLQRFVVLCHETESGTHWDLMLEGETALWTWSIPPQSLPIEPFSVLATRLPDHRLAYLDYEGPVGGNRGAVRRIDAGTFEWIDETHCRLSGNQLCGILLFSASPSVAGEIELHFSPSMP